MPETRGRAATSDRFIGRDYELSALESALRAARDGHPQVRFVGGDAGVGKTRLVDEFARRARADGTRVAMGACVPFLDRPTPFTPVTAALRGLLRDLDGPGRAAVLGPAQPELARLLPDLGPVDDEAGAPGRLLEAIFDVLARASCDAPLVVVLEDLHWADPSTLDVVAYVTRMVSSENLLLVGTQRTDALHRGHPVRRAIAELLRLEAVDVLALRPFDRSELSQQLSAILGVEPPTELLDEVFARSGGNAFFAEELLGAHLVGRRELPETVGDFLAAQLAHLGGPARAMLRSAAVAGLQVRHALLSLINPEPVADETTAVREAIDQGVLVPVADGYAFRHALLREAVLEELLPSERAGLHRRVAETLETRPELGPDTEHARRAELASHWHAAGEAAKAFEAALAAARIEVTIDALAEAGRHFDLALALWFDLPDAPLLAGTDRAGLLVEAAAAEERHSDLPLAVRHLREATTLIDADSEPCRAAEAFAELGYQLWWSGEADEGLAVVKEATALAPADPPSRERARVLARHAQVLSMASRFVEARAAAEEALAVARETGADNVRSHILTTLGLAIGLTGDVEAAVPHFLEARELALHLELHDDVARAYASHGAVLGNNGRNRECLALMLEGVDVAARGAGRSWRRRINMAAAVGCIEVGDLERAEILAASLRGWEAPGQDSIALRQIEAQIALLSGDFARAATELDAAAEAARDYRDVQNRAQIYGQYSALARWQGRPDEARQQVEQGIALLAETDERHFARELFLEAVRVEALASEVARLRGDGSTAGAACARATEHATHITGVSPGSDADRPFVLAATAELGRACGQPDPDAFAAAAEAFEAVPHLPEVATLRLGEAEAALDTGDRSRATAVLRAARRVADGAGMTMFTREYDALARRARIDLAERDTVEVTAKPDLPFGLTERELEVLAHLSEGRTNKQIGQELFVSAKTVATHVSNLLAKLGVASRGEAAAAARRLGLLDSTPG